ncbi:MAG: putative bifunctional diguanylate cyclase/phosphodiesterase [bacterium]
MPLQRTQLAVAVLLILIAGLILVWDMNDSVDDFHRAQEQQASNATRFAEAELEGNIERLQDLANLFAEEQSPAIAALFADPDNLSLRRELEKKVRAYFPDYLAFTVADHLGQPRLVDKGGLIGKGCRRDLSRYAELAMQSPHVHTPYIHFNPMGKGFGRHFDVMVPWQDGEEGIFFVSVRDDYLKKTLNRYEQAGFHLLLLRSEDFAQVELASKDSIVMEKVRRKLDEVELGSIPLQNPVKGTLWHVGALPDTAYESQTLLTLRLRALTTWLIISSIVIVLVSLWHLEIRRRHNLSNLNMSLEKEVRAREHNENELRKLTNYDPLTTLPNRKTVNEFLVRALASAQRYGNRPAVLFFDIDRFQDFNDSLGHGYGDVLLKEAADRLKSIVSSEDILARWGGDEFVVVMQHFEDENEVAELAGQLLEAMRKPIDLHRHNAVATISIGISTYPEAGEDAESLLKNADLAMYRAKNEGRDQSRFFIQEMDDIATERRRLDQEIRAGLKREEFVAFYQPRMDLKTGQIVGCEALMRWKHPVRGLLTPGAFLDVLESGGLIEQVGDAVRRTICNNRIEWHQQGIEVGKVSVNLGGPEFFRHDIVDHLNTEMLHCGLDAIDFEIEITESHVMENTSDSLGKLHALKNLGFSIAVDDFGTGYSSLAYLKRFPVDIVKIDRSFISGCVVNPEDQDILRAILSLAHGLSLRVVAEGVETHAQLELLRELKCDEVQGFLISEPLTFEEYGRFLAENHAH